jgi:hypothetical protein
MKRWLPIYASLTRNGELFSRGLSTAKRQLPFGARIIEASLQVTRMMQYNDEMTSNAADQQIGCLISMNQDAKALLKRGRNRQNHLRASRLLGIQ